MTTVARKQQPTRPEFKALVAHSVREILDDPDYGLELTENVKKKLRVAGRADGKGASLAQIREKYL